MNRAITRRLAVVLGLAIAMLACDNEPFPRGDINGSWSWIKGEGGLLPERNLGNSTFRQTIEIENSHYRDIRMDTVAFEWDFSVEEKKDGYVLKHPTKSHFSKLIKFISPDTVTMETYIESGDCQDCGIDTYVRETSQL